MLGYSTTGRHGSPQILMLEDGRAEQVTFAAFMLVTNRYLAGDPQTEDLEPKMARGLTGKSPYE